ncbi:MAG: hypothetical protein IJH40_02225 [Ruminococcus sp.]|uniref:hypothetical protein n=1 Tax=Ruminococcus sp. TaxID=41978 RepID=UPI0028733641|nr:hypothetical protein [Ruminococcus sp.]MBQ3284435.1 hypothetical protein [Ruminococcus sp.]
MKKTNTKRNKINIIFSSFLVIGYIVCTYFFSSLASQLSGTLGTLVQVLMLLIFGLLLFYATRVGEGKQVHRFSLAVLLLIDLPALYIILAAIIPALPFHGAIAPQNAMAMMGLSSGLSAPSVILAMACVALGYGLPYTFLSGYEMKDEDEEELSEDAPVEGGIAEELAETEAQNEEITEIVQEAAEEEAEEAIEAVEEKAEEAETVEETAEETEAEEEAAEAVEEAAEVVEETEEKKEEE